ncbi:Phosphate transport system permease protein PstC 1 [Meiothermus luteus]|uniref:Phosphate transport system permease protein n=1 Tax=Meiothermus luteus TaxID=2026184 RepID=A0A399EID7_9DEIN|nr:phosphate ABC transporter permease subunit PstC [Meiothermus luteus]RIH84484.1 Phosphate transport system permease protein PstC 1 [Meiothermus luteus]
MNAAAWAQKKPSKSLKERAVVLVLFLLALVSVLTTAGIIFTLFGETLQFFRQVPLLEFLFAPEWTPLFAEPRYGIGALLAGTFLFTAIGLVVAIPLGLLTAAYLSEYAPFEQSVRVKGIMELLEGIPTVVFGYFALLFVTPIFQNLIPGLNLFNPLSAGLVLGFAILPYISNVASDAMMAVPRSLREAAYALGATKFEVVTRVVFPAAISGIVAAIILATSRAIGETMIAAIAAGQRPMLTLDPRETIATMTSYIVQAATGDQPAGSLASRALFSVGTTLFVLTLTFNILAQRIVERYRERYE